MGKLAEGCRQTEKKPNQPKTVSDFTKEPKHIRKSYNEPQERRVSRAKNSNLVFLKKFMSDENVDDNLKSRLVQHRPVREPRQDLPSGKKIINNFQFNESKVQPDRVKDRIMSYIEKPSRNETMDDLQEYSEVKKASPNKQSRYPNLRIFNQKSPLDFNAREMLHLK